MILFTKTSYSTQIQKDLTELAETQIVKTNVSLVNPVSATNNVGPIDLSTKESDRNGKKSDY